MLDLSPLDKSTPVPLYYQLKNRLLNAIRNNDYAEGDMIPTELELSEMYQVSRITVRQAVIELVQEGYLYRVKSKGTFVSRPKLSQDMARQAQSEYNDEIVYAGRSAKTVLMSRDLTDAPAELVREGLAEKNEQYICLVRIRTADAIPFMRMVTWLPYRRFPRLYEQITLEGEGAGVHLHTYMNSSEESRVHTYKRRIEAIKAGPDDLKFLHAEAGDPILKVITERFDKANGLLDYSEAYYLSDQVKVSFTTYE